MRGHRLWHEFASDAAEGTAAIGLGAANDSIKPSQQKTPRRGGGAFLGLLQGGEICISMYVDPWEVGGPLCSAVALVVGSNKGLSSGAEPNQEALMSGG